MERLSDGVRRCWDLVHSDAVRDLWQDIAILDQRTIDDDQLLATYVIENAATIWHPVGSCRMGPSHDGEAVVDERLKVRGADGLRIADASVFPGTSAATRCSPASWSASGPPSGSPPASGKPWSRADDDPRRRPDAGPPLLRGAVVGARRPRGRRGDPASRTCRSRTRSRRRRSRASPRISASWRPGTAGSPNERRFSVEELVAEGDQVAARFLIAARHDGEFLGAPPTGARVEVPGVNLFRLAEGRIVPCLRVLQSPDAVDPAGPRPAGLPALQG